MSKFPMNTIKKRFPKNTRSHSEPDNADNEQMSSHKFSDAVKRAKAELKKGRR